MSVADIAPVACNDQGNKNREHVLIVATHDPRHPSIYREF